MKGGTTMMTTVENRTHENAQARELLRKIAPRAFRNTTLLEAAIVEIRKRYDANQFVKAMNFAQYVRTYAEHAMNA